MWGIVATTVGLLPERIDVTHVVATYGLGTIAGEIVASRRGLVDAATLMRRWGAASMALVAGVWMAALIGVLL